MPTPGAILRNALEALEEEERFAQRRIHEASAALMAASAELMETRQAISKLRDLLAAKPQQILEEPPAESEPAPIEPPIPVEHEFATDAKALIEALDSVQSAPEPPKRPDNWTPFEEREPPLVPQVGNGGPSATALTPEQVAARRLEVMDALVRLWEKGGRVIAADVVKETTLTQYQVYSAINELEAIAEIVTRKEPVRPGDKRTVRAIYSKEHQVAEIAPVVKITPKVAQVAIKAAKEVAPKKTERRQRMLAGAAIREAPGNTMAADVADAVGVDAQMLTPALLKQAGITEAEIEQTTAILRKRIPFEELAPGQCKWEVTGTHDREAYRFCGNKALEDGPYCAPHEWDAHHAQGLHQPGEATA